MADASTSYALFVGGPFQIATLIPNVVIEAVGQDALGITGYPCEDGVTRSDHSFKLPVRLEMLAGWSDSSVGQDGYIQGIYTKLLALQAARQPFDIYTSRRAYRNMLLESLTDPIGARTFSAMVPRITFRELQISQTKTSSQGTTAPASDNVNQADPASTGGVTDRGTVMGQSVGTQEFAGAFNPGAYTVDGAPASAQFFGLNTPGADLSLSPAYDPGGGLAPPTSITLPEISVTTIEGVGGLQAAGPDQYNIFGGGP